ncbi:hypothetical protein [Acinetobacter baumannii]|uniref:hypothetical protein n=1 Tax=Acinetobacter baumannii TaxID=470 RepID=UPI00359F7C55
MGVSFSWELLSKFTSLLAPIVAWLIFSQWNKQKGREVIANECKDGLALLHKDLKVKTSHIYSNLSDNSGMWSA